MKTVLLDMHEMNESGRYYVQNAGKTQQQLNPNWLALDQSADSRIDVLVPGELVRTTKVKIPKNLSHNELKESIRYILEDELLSDTEHTHCVIIDKHADNEASVAIVAPKTMQQWLDALAEKQISPDAVYPDYFAVKVTNEGWTVFQTDSRVLIRFDQTQGLSLPREEFIPLLKQILCSPIQKPRQIVCNGDIPELQAIANEHGITCQIAEIDYPNSKYTPINLMQNGYKKMNTQLKNKLNKFIFGLFLLLPGLMILNQAIEFGYWHYQQSRSANVIANLYRQVYPNATEIIAPKQRVEAELKKLGGLSANAEMIRILKGLSLAWQNTADAKLIELSWQTNRLNLQVELADFAALEDFKTNLQQQGLNVQQQSADSQNNVIKARMSLK